MAKSRSRKTRRKILIVVGVALAIYVAVHAKPYLDDQRTLQHYVDTHTTSAPTTTR